MCVDFSKKFEFISVPKGWTAEDDEKLAAAFNEIGLLLNEKWTASLRLDDISRLSVIWCMEDIIIARERMNELRARIKYLVEKSLDQFQED